ncbi:MAG: DinB family protein [Thermoleophilia bacterium]|nr:DinB family protein [Thermoleophilia bacterium]
MRILSCVSLLALLTLCPAAAQTPDPWDLKQDLIRELEWEQQRATQLAEAIPAETYSWRPAEGVRSIGETLLHMVQNVHYLLSMTGVPTPEGITDDLEKKVADKPQIVKLLGEAYEKALTTIKASDPKNWDREVEFFWKPATVRTVYTRLAVHHSEHIGQLISFARANGVVPPWAQ